MTFTTNTGLLGLFTWVKWYYPAAERLILPKKLKLAEENYVILVVSL